MSSQPSTGGECKEELAALGALCDCAALCALASSSAKPSTGGCKEELAADCAALAFASFSAQKTGPAKEELAAPPTHAPIAGLCEVTGQCSASVASLIDSRLFSSSEATESPSVSSASVSSPSASMSSASSTSMSPSASSRLPAKAPSSSSTRTIETLFKKKETELRYHVTLRR